METTAPHLTHPLPMLLPLTSSVSASQAALAHGGLVAGDLLRRGARTARETLPRPRRISATEALALAPGLRSAGLRGGLLSWDGQLEDDARLVTTIARTAAATGAVVRTRARVVSATGHRVSAARRAHRRRDTTSPPAGWSTPPASGPAISTATCRCGPAAAPTPCCAPTPCPASGPPSPRPCPARPAASSSCSPSPTARCTSASPTSRSRGRCPTCRSRPSRRSGSCSTWSRRRSPTTCGGPTWSAPTPGCGRCWTRAPVPTADLSRRHAVLTSRTGVVTVVGGKLTTYRRMAEDAVDRVVAESRLDAGPCRTRSLPLAGAAPRHGARGLEEHPPAGPPIRHRRRAGRSRLARAVDRARRRRAARAGRRRRAGHARGAGLRRDPRGCRRRGRPARPADPGRPGPGRPRASRARGPPRPRAGPRLTRFGSGEPADTPTWR